MFKIPFFNKSKEETSGKEKEVRKPCRVEP